MKKFTDVPIPIWMAKLPKDRRGYPIPSTVLIDKNGRPHFTINDEAKRQEVIRKGHCAICDRKLLKRRALVGGPGSAILDGGAYIDPPMHLECARYALMVCPYLAAPQYVKRIDAGTLKPGDVDMPILQDPTMLKHRPDLFVMVIFTKSKNIMGAGNLVKYVKPLKPYFGMEYWLNGEQIPQAEGEELTKEALVALMANDENQT